MGRIPNDRLPNTFTAMGYDLPDPRVGYPYYVGGKLAPGEKHYNCSAGEKDHYPNAQYQSEVECETHPPPLPKPLMGSIHPRNKRLLGWRLARAAKAIVYGDKTIAYTGPVLAGCSLIAGKLTLQFETALFPPGERLHFKGNNLGNLTSNLELEIEGEWVMVPIAAADPATNTVTATMPAGKTQASAVRYAWYDNPACPAAYDHFHVLSAPYFCLDSSYDVAKPGSGLDATNMCALYSAPSDLPAVPFHHAIEAAKCV